MRGMGARSKTRSFNDAAPGLDEAVLDVLQEAGHGDVDAVNKSPAHGECLGERGHLYGSFCAAPKMDV